MNNSLPYAIGLKNDNKFEFSQKHSLATRKSAVLKYHKDNQIVVICEPHRLFNSKSTNNPAIPILILNKHDPIKSVYQVIDSKVKLDKQDTFFLFCNNKLLQMGNDLKYLLEDKLENIYQKYKNQEDEILYIKFCNQEAFGNM